MTKQHKSLSYISMFYTQGNDKSFDPMIKELTNFYGREKLGQFVGFDTDPDLVFSHTCPLFTEFLLENGVLFCKVYLHSSSYE